MAGNPIDQKAIQAGALVALRNDQVVEDPVLLRDACSTPALGFPLGLGSPHGIHLRPPCLLQRRKIFSRKPPRLFGLLELRQHSFKRCSTSIGQRHRPVDLPFGIDQRGEHLGRTVECLCEVRPKAAVLQVMAAAYRPACLPEIETALAAGDRSIRRWIGGVRLHVIEAETLAPHGGPSIFANVNTPEDLARVAAILAPSGHAAGEVVRR